MSENGIEAVGTPTGDERQDMRLMTLLRSMVREKLLKGAAETLGLDPRTVQTSMDRGELSDLVRIALERHVLADSDEKAAEQRERIDALERRVDALAMEVRSGLKHGRGVMNDECQALREEQVWASNQQAKSRLEGGDEVKEAPGDKQDKGNRQVEGAPEAQGVTKAPAPTTKAEQGPERTVLGRRLYPELLYKEPWPDDEEVYGEAWHLISEWRELWNSHSNSGKGLVWLRTEQRIRALEVAMLEQHGLTLPPEKQPLYGLDRRDQLIWRKETLREVRRSLAWRELLRCVLTLGLRRS